MRQFYGRLEKCVLSAGKKTMSIKWLVLGGGDILGLGGGGSADFNFMGVRIFLNWGASYQVSQLFLCRHFGMPEIT